MVATSNLRIRVLFFHLFSFEYSFFSTNHFTLNEVQIGKKLMFEFSRQKVHVQFLYCFTPPPPNVPISSSSSSFCSHYSPFLVKPFQPLNSPASVTALNCSHKMVLNKENGERRECSSLKSSTTIQYSCFKQFLIFVICLSKYMLIVYNYVISSITMRICR